MIILQAIRSCTIPKDINLMTSDTLEFEDGEESEALVARLLTTGNFKRVEGNPHGPIVTFMNSLVHGNKVTVEF